MEKRTLQSALRVPSEENENDVFVSPDSSFTTRFTPDDDSEDEEEEEEEEEEEDLELVHGELGEESYELQRRTRGRWDVNGDADLEKRGSGVEYIEEEEEDAEGSSGYRRRRASVSTVQSYQLYTPDEERAVVRKFDRKLVLFVALLYMLSFLDRSNIGNAKIAGLDLDLDLDSTRYEWVITAFYMAYISFEWMSILWKIIPAHIYITCIVLSWGLVASLQSIATSFESLLVLRVLLGIGEAGFTGIPFYLSFFFKRDELALRTGYFIAAAPLATSFASTLAWGIIYLGKNIPIAPWRLLFLVEGFPSIFVAVAAWNIIPDSPSTASYLTTREKKVARLRLRKSLPSPSTTKQTTTTTGLSAHSLLLTLLDPKAWLTSLILLLTNLAFSSLPVFLPTIIHEQGHSVLASQALTAPPFLLSFIIVIITAYLSDRHKNRSAFMIFHALLSASGYGLIYVAGLRGWSPWFRYAGIYPAAVGFFSVVTLVIAWSINNQESEAKQGIGFAMMQIVGQCGPLIGTRLYPEEEAPLYLRGMAVCAGAMVGVAVLSLVLRFFLMRLNKRGEKAVEGGEYGRLGVEEEEGDELVSKRLKLKERFEYML